MTPIIEVLYLGPAIFVSLGRILRLQALEPEGFYSEKSPGTLAVWHWAHPLTGQNVQFPDHNLKEITAPNLRSCGIELDHRGQK